MKVRARIALRRTLSVVAALLISVTSVSAQTVATSKGAMSPRVTSQSYGARLQETALGNFVADGMRQHAGTDIAIECGGHLVKALPGGSITEEDVRAVFSGDLELAVVELTAEQLFDVLEYAVSYAQIDESEELDGDSGFDGFPQISGFSFEFDVSQKAGRRLRSVTLSDGAQLSRDTESLIRAAVPMDMLDGTLGFPMLEGLPFRVVGRQGDILTDYVRSQGQIVIPATDRITMLGAAGETLYQTWKVGTWLPYVILLILLFRLPWRSKRRRKTDDDL